MATIPTTLVTVALPLSLCNLTSHCGVLPHSERGMGEINQCHYLLSPFTVNRTGSSVADPTPTTPTGLGNPPQEQPCCQAIPQGRDGQIPTGSGLSLLHSAEEISKPTCKYLPPLEAIKEEPRFTTKPGGQGATGSTTQHLCTS